MPTARFTVLAIAMILAAGCGRYGFGDGRDGGVDLDVDAGPGAGVDARPGTPLDCDAIPGVLVCSGFEPGDTPFINESSGNGGVSSQCTNPHAGQGCLVASISAGGAAARGMGTYTPVGSGMIYARAYAFIEAGAPIDGINIFTLDALDSGVFGLDLNVIDDDKFQLHMSEPNFTSGNVGPVPLGSWFCLHASVLVSNSSGAISGGYESVSISSGDLDTFPNGPYDMVGVGLDWTSDQQGPITVSIDDVVVATSPVPCP